MLFRCHCGDVVTVAAGESHDAAVIRCGACGGSRGESAEICQFCEARFSTYERELEAVCAVCLARISQRAAFCPACGEGVRAKLSAGQASGLPCPVCGPETRLYDRQFEGRGHALECHTCGGFWLQHADFEVLARRAQSETTPRGSEAPKKLSNPLHQAGPMYRRCPECEGMMARRNHQGLGVIIDFCKDHGVWFDLNELEDLLGALRARAAKQSGAKHMPSTTKRDSLPTAHTEPVEGCFADPKLADGLGSAAFARDRAKTRLPSPDTTSFWQLLADFIDEAF